MVMISSNLKKIFFKFWNIFLSTPKTCNRYWALEDVGLKARSSAPRPYAGTYKSYKIADGTKAAQEQLESVQQAIKDGRTEPNEVLQEYLELVAAYVF